jgi:uncharacterized protein involved in exopolysaccharide biosynthesis
MLNNNDNAIRPPEDETAINLLDLLLVVVKRKTMIICITLAAAVLTALYSLSLPNIYTSKALIYPSQEDKGLANAMMAQLGGLANLAGGSLGGKTLEDLYITLLKSEAIKDPIIDRLGLMKRFKAKYRTGAYRRLDAVTMVSAGKKDGVITISVSDRDPRWAAALADAYVRELGNLTIRLNVTGAGKNRLFLENRLGEAKADLGRAEEALRTFQARNKVLNVPEQAKATIQGVAQLRAQLALEEVQLATMRRQFTDASQEVKNARATITNLKTQVEQLEGQGGGSIPSVGSVPGLGQEYVRLMREFKIQESIVELMTKQYELARINELKDVVPFQVIQSAKVPERKSKPKRSRMVILATMAAFFASVFFAFIREYADRMPQEDKARWREIGDMSGLRGIVVGVGSIWAAFSMRTGRNGRG